MVNNEGYLRSIPHVVLFAFVNHTIYKTNLCFLFILVTFVNYNFIITNLFTPLKMEENEALIVAERMKSFIEYKGISVTQFADATKIQRSSMSQILGGRNQKISINTIGKIHSAYPDLSIYWLLYGTGPMILPSRLIPSGRKLPAHAQSRRPVLQRRWWIRHRRLSCRYPGTGYGWLRRPVSVPEVPLPGSFLPGDRKSVV